MAAQDALTALLMLMRTVLKAFGHTLLPAFGALGVLSGAALLADAGQARAPAPSLVRPRSAAEAPDPDGFLRRWVLLEPIPVSGQLTENAVQTAVGKTYFPNQFDIVPHDGDVETVGTESLTWHAVETIAYNVNLFHFAYALNKPTSNVLFWAVTVVTAPADLPGVRLAIGSNAASVWWLNGQQVIALYNDRQTVVDDGVSKRLTLKKGRNVVRAGVINAGGATDFCARFLDENGSPVKGFTIDLDASANGR